MIRKMKSLLCGLLAVVILSALFVMPAGAASNGYLSIEFYKPADWADTVKIHLWNAGEADTQWDGVNMEKLSNGTYRYTTNVTGSADFVINDGSGRQTSDLHAEGIVSVKDDTVIESCGSPIRLNFKKPADWSDDISCYYYTNDGKAIHFTEWPGKPMSKDYYGSYYATISNMADARVIFTDGTHQYPPVSQEGIPVKDGEELLFQGGKYTVNKHNWLQIDQPASYVFVNDTISVRTIMDIGSDFPLMFYDTARNVYVDPEGYTETKDNGKVIRNYTFAFSEKGQRNLQVHYYYHSSVGFTDKNIKFEVLPESETTSNTYIFSSDRYDLLKGEEFTLTACHIWELTYTVWSDNGEKLIPKSVSYSDDGRYTYMTFTADQLGQFQKLHLCMHNWRNPIPIDTGSFVTINVWQPVSE